MVEFRDQCRQLDGEERLTKGKDGKDPVEKDARMLSQVGHGEHRAGGWAVGVGISWSCCDVKWGAGLPTLWNGTHTE